MRATISQTPYFSRLWWAIAVLAVPHPACLDYTPFAKDDSGSVPRPDSKTSTDSAVWPQFIEICDGLDNDGDGAVDEGFADLDGNGVIDCLECVAMVEPAGEIEIRDDCGPDVAVDDPWNVVVEWEIAGLGSLPSPPIVGDLDRDGIPELVLRNATDRLFTLRGIDGVVQWSIPWESDWYSASVIADATADSGLELIVHLGDSDKLPVLLDHAGAKIWSAYGSDEKGHFRVAVVSDLEGDGRLEVLSDDTIYDLETGAALATLPRTEGLGSIPAIGDLDLDGRQEIALGGCVYDHEYQQRWCVEDGIGSWFSSAALLQLDSDDEAEVLFLGERLGIYDPDGAQLLLTDPLCDDAAPPSAPAIADFDGDGQVEIAFACRGTLQLREVDGTQRWRRLLDDDTGGWMGIIGFDFDADGANELVVTDSENLYILDGSNGGTLFQDDRHRSQTILDHPLVVDIDADGAAEIVLASWFPDEDDVSLRVFGHVANAWPSTGTHWPSYDFQVTNIREDGSLCTEEPYPWQEWNMYRARPAAGGPRPNHTLVLNDTCGGTCMDAGFIEVSFQIGNDGIRGALAGATVSLYRLEDDQRVLLDHTTTTSELAPGALGSSQTLRAPVGEVRGATLQLEVVGDPSRPECESSDNILSFESPC